MHAGRVERTRCEYPQRFVPQSLRYAERSACARPHRLQLLDTLAHLHVHRIPRYVMADPQTITIKKHSNGGGPVNSACQRARRHEEENCGGADEHPGMGNHVVTPVLVHCKTTGLCCASRLGTLAGGAKADSIPCVPSAGARE